MALDSGLAGKSCLITGGASGIGFGIAKSLAQEGINLAVASRKPDPAALEQLRGMGVEVVGIEADVSKEDQAVNMVKTAISHFGQLDLYVNNAAWTWHEPITRITTEGLMNTFQTNLAGCVWACREVSRHMIQRGQGSILIVGSTATYTPQATETSYRITKTGLLMTMQVLAIELAPYKIRVNMIIPGHYVTRLTGGFVGEPLERFKKEIPLRRTGEVEEVGPAAVLLLSDKLSGYTTGASLIIDGGLHLRPLPKSDEELRGLNAPDPSWGS